MNLVKKIVTSYFLESLAIFVLISMFFKCLTKIDTSYDSWWYHLPFAARLWNIVPKESYLFEDFVEERFLGFPLLGEFFQGLFWFVFHYIQAANLVCFISLIVYLYFLRKYCHIPLFLSAIALLAVPLIQVHATSCYVDLPANISLSILIMMTYLIYIQRIFFNKNNILLVFISSVCATNTKYQVMPFVALFLGLLIVKFVWDCRQIIFEFPKQYKKLISSSIVILFALTIVFIVPLKNILFYQNPFYPEAIKTEYIAPVEKTDSILNNAEKTATINNSKIWAEAFLRKEQKWLNSVLEIKSAKWSVSQGSRDRSLIRMGGFFGTYVVFNLFLLGYIFYRYKSRETHIAIILFVPLTVLNSLMPLSYELRYYMHWIIILISLNLYLVSLPQASLFLPKIIGQKNIALVCLGFLLFVITATNAIYVKPQRYGLEKMVERNVKLSILNEIEPGDKVCLFKTKPHTFLYAREFNKQLNYHYLVKAAKTPQECQGFKRIKN
jgi:hypothetical protein